MIKAYIIRSTCLASLMLALAILPSSATLNRVPTVQATAPTISIKASGSGNSVGNGGVLQLSVPPGGSANVDFSAAITPGTGTVTRIEWQSNGVTISTQSSFSYAFGRGLYGAYLIGLTVENSAGQRSTAGIGIIVNEVPTQLSLSTVTPQSTPFAGQQFVARLDGTGFDPNTIQVLVTGQNCSPCVINNNVLSNKSSTRVDAPLTLNNPGTYQISVRNGSSGTPSNSLPLTVSVVCAPPSIVNHPNNMTISSGGTATLNVSASGTVPLMYQWYRGASGDTSSPISGATNSSFTTPQLTSTTNFWVRVSNPCGSVSSNAAIVTVSPACLAVSIVTHPTNPSPIISGQSATLTVSASGTTPL